MLSKTVLIATTILSVACAQAPAPSPAPPAAPTPTPEEVKVKAPDPSPKEIEATIRASLGKHLPPESILSIEPSPLDSLWEVHLKNGLILQITPDGRTFIPEKVFSFEGQAVVDLSEKRLAKKRATKLKTLNLKELIVFKPDGPVRASITVFADVDCGYSVKFHSEIQEYLKYGIEVRYAAWPRAGLDTDVYRRMVSAWCSADRHDAFNKLNEGVTIPDTQCPESPVAKQIAFGSEIGVSGTPAIYSADGEQLGGYLPAQQLAELLNLSEEKPTSDAKPQEETPSTGQAEPTTKPKSTK